MAIPRFPKAPNNTEGTFANADVPSVEAFTTTQSTPSVDSGFTIGAGDSYNLIGGTANPVLQHQAGNVVPTVDTPDLGFQEGLPSEKGGLTNTAAANIGAGIQVGTQIAQGVAQGVSASKLQDAAFMQGNEQLDAFASEQLKNIKVDERAQDLADVNQRFDKKAKNIAFRQQMFQRDLAKELEQYNDATSNLGVIQDLVKKDENFKDSLLQLNRNRR